MNLAFRSVGIVLLIFKIMIAILLIASLFGTISGAIWAFALSAHIKDGLLYGCITGFCVGILFLLMQLAATAGGKVQKREATFVSSSFLFTFFLVSCVIAIVVRIIRWIFF